MFTKSWLTPTGTLQVTRKAVPFQLAGIIITSQCQWKDKEVTITSDMTRHIQDFRDKRAPVVPNHLSNTGAVKANLQRLSSRWCVM